MGRGGQRAKTGADRAAKMAAPQGRRDPVRRPAVGGASVEQKASATVSRRGGMFGALGLLLLGLAAYSSSFRGAFLLDDTGRILNDPKVHHLWSKPRVLLRDSRPLVTLSLAANYAIHGTDTWGYHLVNVVVHLIAGLALFGIVRRTVSLWDPHPNPLPKRGREQMLRSAQHDTPRGEQMFRSAQHDTPGGGEMVRSLQHDKVATGLGFVVAAVWLLHPLQTQSVTYVIQRAESMMGMFYLITLYFVIRGATAAFDGHSGRRTGLAVRWLWYTAAALACLLGMYCKAGVMLTAPAIVLLYDIVFLSGTSMAALRRRWGLYVLLGMTWLALFQIRLIEGVFGKPAEGRIKTVGFGSQAGTPGQYLMTQPAVILRYLRLSVLPVGQCLDYGWPVVKEFRRAALPGIVILGVLAATAWGVRRRSWMGFAGAWLFVILSPTSSFIPIKDVMFEHRMYLPLAGVVALGVIGGWGLPAKTLNGRGRMQTALCIGTASLMIAGLGAATYARNLDYQSDVGMWRDVVEKQPNNPRGWGNLGKSLTDAGNYEEAIKSLMEALARQPKYPEVLNNLAKIYLDVRSYPAALEYAMRAHKLDSKNPLVLNNLANSLLMTEKAAESLPYFDEAIRRKPGYVEAYSNRGIALTKLGRYDEAIASFQDALRLSPGYFKAETKQGNALRAAGRIEEAEAAYRRAIKLAPANAEALAMLASLCHSTQRVDEAITLYRQALSSAPEDYGIRCDLGAVLFLQKRYAESAAEYRRAVESKADYLSAWYFLGRSLEEAKDQGGAREAYRKAVTLEPGYRDAAVRLRRLEKP